MERKDCIVTHLIKHLPLHFSAPPAQTLPLRLLRLRQRREISQKVTRALIPIRINIQILLMIILCIPPLPRLQDLCRNLAALEPLFLHTLRHVPRNSLLLGVVVKNGATVLGADIGALTVGGCGVVHTVEKFEELAVCELVGVEYHLEGFGVWCGRVLVLSHDEYLKLGRGGRSHSRPVRPEHTAL